LGLIFLVDARRLRFSNNQKERAQLLFERYPELKKAYQLSMDLSHSIEKTTEKIYSLARLANWHESVK